MAELTTLARPYAKACFAHAVRVDALMQWSNALAILAAAVKEESVANMLASPQIPSQQKASSLIAFCGDDANEALGRFATVLAENRRLPLLPYIRYLFERFKAQKEKFTNVEVLTAFPLDEDTEKMLADKLGANLDSRINMKVNVDETLIGGIVIRVGDTVTDGSVRGRLTKLAEAMN